MALNVVTELEETELYVGSVFFGFFWASWSPLGALWDRFGMVRASILEVFRAHFLQNPTSPWAEVV